MFHFGTNHHANGGTASCRSAVFFGSEEEDGRGRERESGRMGEDLERMEEEFGREGKPGLLTGRNNGFEEGKKGNRESCDSIAGFR